jgi:hypothetical protein
MFMFLDVDFIVIVLARESALVAATPKQLLQDEIRQSFKKRFSTLLRNTWLGKTMGRLLISRRECGANSARRRTTANFTVVSPVLSSGYVEN